MNDKAEIHRSKIPGKTYVSPSIPTKNGALRIASKVIDSEGLYYAKVKQEVVLRRTEKGRTEIIAKFLEDDRNLRVVTLQAFNGNTKFPQNVYFSFVAEEIPKLLQFFYDIAAMDLENPHKINIKDSDLKNIVLSKKQAFNIVNENQQLFSEVLQAALTKEDVIAFGYRKKQLDVFKRLLTEPDYFDLLKESKKVRGDEALWQEFFEKNQWIFGYGLSYFFVTGFDNSKLEQIVKGHDLLNHGKRIDGLMKSRGIISALCFVEIKRHDTKLLSTQYRPGCWSPSSELVGAVAQVQGTVSSAMETLHGLIRLQDKEGNPTGEFVTNFKPRAFIVAGSLSEFLSEHGVNTDRMRSFELFRNSIEGIDILTFDELYERSKFIVDASSVSASRDSQQT